MENMCGVIYKYEEHRNNRSVQKLDVSKEWMGRQETEAVVKAAYTEHR